MRKPLFLTAVAALLAGCSYEREEIGAASPARGLELASIAPLAGCPYGSLQTRVQPDLSTAWSATLTLEAGQWFRVAAFHDGSGDLADPDDVIMAVFGPNGYFEEPVSGSFVPAPYTGTYTVQGACGDLIDSVTVTATPGTSGTDPQRFAFGIGVAWGSQWQELPTYSERVEWDRRSLNAIENAGATATNASFDWVNIEIAPGVYDWSYADHQVLEAERRGLEMFAYTGNTPVWALPPDTPSCGDDFPPSARFPPASDAAGIAAFEGFHEQLAERYCGRVKYYSFWNEPNGCSWMSCTCGGQTVEQKREYAQWLERWYRAMKKGCSDVVLAVGGLDCAWGGDPDNPTTGCGSFIHDLYAFGAGTSFDAVAMHPYGYHDLEVALQEDKTLNWAAIAAVNQALQSWSHGYKKLWLNEWGFATVNDLLKADLVTKTLEALRAGSVPNLFQAQYLTITDIPSGARFGLADHGFGPATVTPRPASWYAFRTESLGPTWTRVGPRHSGLERQTGAEGSSVFAWGPDGTWAYHTTHARPGSEVLGRKFGRHQAGTGQTVGAVLNATFAPATRYRVFLSAQGGLDDTGTFEVELGYQAEDGTFQLLRERSFTVGRAWVDLSGAVYTTGATGAEIGRPVWVRLGAGGADDVWFDNVRVQARPMP